MINFFRMVFLFFELERFPSETLEKYEKFFNLRTRKFDFLKYKNNFFLKNLRPFFLFIIQA